MQREKVYWANRLTSLTTARADEWNCTDFNFRFGPLGVWSGMAPCFGALITSCNDGATGVRLQLDLPYLHLRLTLALPIRALVQWGWRTGTGRPEGPDDVDARECDMAESDWELLGK